VQGDVASVWARSVGNRILGSFPRNPHFDSPASHACSGITRLDGYMAGHGGGGEAAESNGGPNWRQLEPLNKLAEAARPPPNWRNRAHLTEMMLMEPRLRDSSLSIETSKASRFAPTRERSRDIVAKWFETSTGAVGAQVRRSRPLSHRVLVAARLLRWVRRGTRAYRSPGHPEDSRASPCAGAHRDASRQLSAKLLPGLP